MSWTHPESTERKLCKSDALAIQLPSCSRYFSYPKHHDKGYMTEALLGLMQYAFINDNVTCIETGCLAINKASERVMIKCGFTKTNELEQYELFEGKYETRVEYCITREEYLREI